MAEIYNRGSRCAYFSGSALQMMRTENFFLTPLLTMPCSACFIVLLFFGFCMEFQIMCRKRFPVVSNWYGTFVCTIFFQYYIMFVYPDRRRSRTDLRTSDGSSLT